MLLGLLGSLYGLIKVSIEKTVVDDVTFRMHYRWTTLLCFVSCALVATSELIGSPIECLKDGKEAPKPMTTFCWVQSTFTINTHYAEENLGNYLAYDSNYHGLGNFDPEKHEKRVHAYYQWVPMMLFGMGCMFYLPHMLWKSIEGRRADSLLQGLQLFHIGDEVGDAIKRKNIVEYFKITYRCLNKRYSYGYLIVQILNLFNVMIIMFALESFFGGVFLDYGYKTLQYFTGHADNSTFHPMIEAFPTIAKCEFFKYGPSGTIEKHDLVCLLPQNIINEKIFLLLWFWFVFLSTCSCIQIVYIAALFISPYLRTKLLERNGKMVTTEQLEKLVRKLDTGDFFLLMTIISNLDGISVRDVLQGLISGILGNPTMGNKDESCPNGFGKTVENMFSPNAPTYRPFNMEDVDPVEYKRRMEADDTCV